MPALQSALNLRRPNGQSSTCWECVVKIHPTTAVLLQAFTIIGGGRVGQALADMGSGSDVSGTAAGMQTLARLVCGNAKVVHQSLSCGTVIDVMAVARARARAILKTADRSAGSNLLPGPGSMCSRLRVLSGSRMAASPASPSVVPGDRSKGAAHQWAPRSHPGGNTQ
jgi:hypothetical protein